MKKYKPAQTETRVKKYKTIIDKIKYLVIHCSASDRPQHDNPESIDQWHLQRGWTGIGYHFFIDTKGIIHCCRPIKYQGAHVKGHNNHSIGICLHGNGIYTDTQIESLKSLLKLLNCLIAKGYSVKGHYELNPKKTCPIIDMDKFRKSL